MKLFVIGDVHGHFDQMKEALDAAGFYDCEGQLFVDCGDNFDRGKQNREVFSYLSGLKHAFFLRGNHEDYLEDLLQGAEPQERDRLNGTLATAQEFADLSLQDEVLAFLKRHRDYFETKRYLFVHGWLPVDFSDSRPEIATNWRTLGRDEWRIARETEWQQAYAYGLTLPDKTVVCGHRPATLASQFDASRYSDDYYPFFGKGVIALDPFVTRSKKVFVVTLEDELFS